MQRLILAAILLLSGSWATAQTVKITTPTGTCTYSTGAVKSDPAVPGQLIATAAAVGTGTGCSQGTGAAVTFGPASPLSPANVPLSSTGGATSLQFQPANAVTCTASVSGGSNPQFSGGATSLQTCNSAASCSNAQVIAPTFAPNTTQNAIANTVSVTCKDANNNSAVSSSTVTVAAQGVIVGGCTNPIAVPNSAGGTFTQWTGQKSVNILGGNQRLADVASFDSLFGTWPGGQGVIIYPTLPTNNYIAAAFKSTNNFITNAPANQYGEYYMAETDHSVAVSMTISTACGDFSNPATHSGSTVVAGCYANKLPTSSYLAWTKSGSCQLQDGVQYYLNIINADISNVGPNGTGSATTTYDSSNRFCSAQGCVNPIEVILP